MRIEINLNKEKQRRRKFGLSLKNIRPGRFIKAPPMLLTILGVILLATIYSAKLTAAIDRSSFG